MRRYAADCGMGNQARPLGAAEGKSVAHQGRLSTRPARHRPCPAAYVAQRACQTATACAPRNSAERGRKQMDNAKVRRKLIATQCTASKVPDRAALRVSTHIEGQLQEPQLLYFWVQVGAVQLRRCCHKNVPRARRKPVAMWSITDCRSRRTAQFSQVQNSRGAYGAFPLAASATAVAGVASAAWLVSATAVAAGKVRAACLAISTAVAAGVPSATPLAVWPTAGLLSALDSERGLLLLAFFFTALLAGLALTPAFMGLAGVHLNWARKSRQSRRI